VGHEEQGVAEAEADFFSGDERVRTFAPIGRMMRMGSPEALLVPDAARLREAIVAGDGERASAYAALLRREHGAIVSLLVEWALEMPRTLSLLVGAGGERPTTDRALAIFDDLSRRDGIPRPADGGEAASRALVLARELFASVDPDTAPAHRASVASGAAGPVQPLLDALAAHHDALDAGIAALDPSAAADALERAWDFARTAHDAAVHYTSAYPTAVLEVHGQPRCEELLRRSFESCSFFEGLWSAGLLPPRELAAFLAEHLRSHFSGNEREGAARIVEDDDKVRLVLEPCGSGGALRRRAGRQGIAVLPHASPATWGRAGEVPAYCAHCAFNELESIARFGYPLLVTEFDPDPAQPCGWTIYKRPEAIPERYFTRLGRKREGPS
jgi:hypothetical protein